MRGTAVGTSCGRQPNPEQHQRAEIDPGHYVALAARTKLARILRNYHNINSIRPIGNMRPSLPASASVISVVYNPTGL